MTIFVPLFRFCLAYHGLLTSDITVAIVVNVAAVAFLVMIVVVSLLPLAPRAPRACALSRRACALGNLNCCLPRALARLEVVARPSCLHAWRLLLAPPRWR